ncbi:MAG TPA: SpoIIE family protein phosphatase [Thermoanaerobaculia bacterium]|nr:SpoIIE family protein phosphatase [Thermoanaerobaculia bacterium]
MKIRSQLVLACFILAVLPLTGIVLYSYHSSRRALESAYRLEAQRLTRQMDRRLTSIRTELDERLASLSSIPISTTADGTGSGRNAVIADILAAMGETAPLVDGLTIVPRPPAVPGVAAVAPSGAVAPPAAPQIPQLADVEPPEDTDDEAELTASIVIDIPRVIFPSFEMPAAAQRKIGEIASLSDELARKAGTMPRQERDAKKAEIRRLQEAFDAEMEASREKFRKEMADAQRVMRERQADRERRMAARAAPKPSSGPAPRATVKRSTQSKTKITRVEDLSTSQKARIELREKQAGLILGRQLNVPLQQEGEIVGQIRAQLRTGEVVRRVLGASPDDGSEIPFAVDREGTVYARNPRDKATVERLGIPERVKSGQALRRIEDWIVVSSKDEDSGLQFGVARPVGENLVDLKQTAARNFGYGMGLIAFALIGIIPLANHFARDVRMVTDGAERIAQGDLMTRLPVRSKSEFGQLALAFNRMAEDLSSNQQKLFEQERARREQEVQQRVFAIEYERKSVDLEDARRFQLSMLPKELPQHDHYEVAVFTQTATEVGGDYYDFHVSEDGTLSVTIGDATGHGAKAGTMVTVIKTLFVGYDSATTPSAFLGDAAEKIKRMDLGRMSMALSLARFDPSLVTIASAGMPPLLVFRKASSRIAEVTLPATPLGTIGVDYPQAEVALEAGDTALLMSDGFPELLNSSGEQLGYVVAAQEFARAATLPTAQDVIDALREAVREWHGEQPPNDDITFVVVRARSFRA